MNEILIIIISSLIGGFISFIVSYRIMILTHKKDKELQYKIQHRVEQKQMCDEALMLICDFNSIAYQTFKIATELLYIRTGITGLDLTTNQRNDFIENKQLEYDSNIGQMEMLKNKIMLKIDGIDELVWIPEKLSSLLKMNLFTNEPKGTYSRELIELSDRAKNNVNQYIETL